MGKRRKPKKHLQRLASARISFLWEQAIASAISRPERARQWMGSARKIAQKARIKLPCDISRQVCKECDTVLIPGRTCRVRIRHNRSRHMTVTCMKCGAIRRFPVTRKA